MIPDAVEVDVAGVRLTTTPGARTRAVLERVASVNVVPTDVADGAGPIVDAMSGRGDAEIADDLRGLARLFLSA
jgi:hypothetical protein